MNKDVTLLFHTVGQSCAQSGANYNHQLLGLLTNNTLDYTLLGVGRDGHVASIFPEDAVQTEITIGEQMLAVSVKDNYYIKIKERVTLYLSTILQSRNIGVILTGTNKCDVFKRIQRLDKQTATEEDWHLPVIQLIHKRKTNNGLKIYIDKCICK